MTDAALFDLGAVGLVPEPVPPRLSPDRRRTLRQADALARGCHPIGLYLGRQVRLHAEAPPVDDRSAPGRRCGNCWYRQVYRGERAGRYPKCALGDGVRASHSAATDVRSWWPGCVDHEYADPAVGPDAARWAPPTEGGNHA